MAHLRHMAIVAALMVAAPGCALAAGPRWASPRTNDVAYREGYERGQLAGTEDYRRGNRYQFADESDYRYPDTGYRVEFGDRTRYRAEFRRGFQAGYEAGYRPAGRDDRSTGNRIGVPPRTSGRGGRSGTRYDLAVDTGYRDGYRAGLSDAEHHRRSDAIAERDYRSADRGYDRRYGPRDRYKANYRAGFREGYETGYREGTRAGDRRW